MKTISFVCKKSISAPVRQMDKGGRDTNQEVFIETWVGDDGLR